MYAINQCAECGRPLPWHDDAPALWDGAHVYFFCSAQCQVPFRRRVGRPLQAA